MNTILKRTAAPALLAATALAASAFGAQAATPMGVWLDHTGRAAIEITDCAGKLCGRLVWFKEAENVSACNLQIIGDVKPMSGGKWDKGWILDPEKNSKYDVEITPLGESKLKVMGYAGMKMLSETFTWPRAPADLKLCGTRAAERTPPAEETPAEPPPPAADPKGPPPGAGPGTGP